MIQPHLGRDLALLTTAKLLVLAAIYLALFAPAANKPLDTASHLLGPANTAAAQGN
jgi:hypothetical protein